MSFLSKWFPSRKTLVLVGSLGIGAYATIDFVGFQFSEKKRKRLTRVTESFRNQYGGQQEVLKSNLGLLITPRFGNMHSFDQYDHFEDLNATEINFKECLDSYIEWRAKQIQFKNIPENVMNMFTNYWDVFRTDPFVIKDKYHIYRLLADEYQSSEVDDDEEDVTDKNIVYDELKETDIDDVLRIDEKTETEDKFYMQQVIQSERVSIGAYDTEKSNKLVGYSYVNMDDLSASKVVLDKDYAQKGSSKDVAMKLGQLTVRKHFDQGYNHLDSNVDVDDTEHAQMRQNMGFKRLPETYYWVQSQRVPKV